MENRIKYTNGGEQAARTGQIIRRERTGCVVATADQTYFCTMTKDPCAIEARADKRGRKRRKQRGADDGPDPGCVAAVGDFVEFTVGADNRGTITSVAAQRNRISRRAAGPRPVEQVIAANIDQLAAVFAAAEPAPSWTMLDRYLVIAESAGIDVVICLTKTDLVNADCHDEILRRYRQLGYTTRRVSCVTGNGMDALREEFRDKTTLLAGKSGVGKSTMLNLLAPEVAQSVAPVSRSGKGRHTTTQAEMFPLPGGGQIIDTPGVRELGLWGVTDNELASCFPEMRPFLGNCAFAQCSHAHEPGCAVREAVTDGSIFTGRYESYLRMRRTTPAGIKHDANGQRKRAFEPQGFDCVRCNWKVSPDAAGTDHRNHCPQCLWSAHLDVRPGDRSAACGGVMEPIAVWVRQSGEWALVHLCADCGAVRTNRIAGDDNPMILMSLAARALARPPFPLDRLATS